jgi:AraC-like DNA-binding protein
MNFHIHRPAANLHPYVKHYYYWHDDTTGVITLPQSLLSLGDQYMVFLQQGEVSCQPCQHAAFQLPAASIIGHFTCASQLRVKGPVKMVIVQFNAYGSYRMLGMNMHAISNYYRNLAKLPDNNWQQLSTRLQAANAEQVPALLNEALQQAMQQQAGNMQAIEKVVDYMEREKGYVSIGYVASRFRLSRPTLERMFMEVVGLPPKLYARMLRFKSSMRTMQTNNSLPQDYAYFNRQTPSFFMPSGTTAAVAHMPSAAGMAVA